MDHSRRSLLRLLAVAPLAAVVSTRLIAGDDPIDHFLRRYADLTSVDVSFKSDRLEGRLRAQKGGLYRIEAGDRLFVSDGSTIWNVQRTTKTVVLDRATAQPEEMSVDRIFFVLLNVYTPSIKTGGAAPTLRLSPPDPSARIAGVEWADVSMNAKYEITSITVREGGSTTTWKITNLRRDPKLPADLFSYAVPQGWNAVDLR